MPKTNIREGLYHPDFDPELIDFRNFVAVVWERLGLPPPTDIQDEVARYLQRGPEPRLSPWETPNDRVMVGGYRGMGKSWLTACLVDHTLALDPTLNILVISGSQAKSDEFTQFAKRLIEEMPELAHICPSQEERSRWSGPKFDVLGAGLAQAPSVRSASITGTIVGARADMVVPDDIETPQNAETQSQRDRTDRLTDQFPFIYKERSRVVYLGTFQCEDSHYLKLPAKGYWMRLWPGRFPGEPKTGAYCGRDAYQDLLAPSYDEKLAANPELAGQPADPLRFDEVELQKKEREVGGANQIELQMGLNPNSADRMRYPLHLEDLIVMDCHRDLAPESVIYARHRDTQVELPNPGLRGDYLYRPWKSVGEWKAYTGALTFIDPAGGGPDECAWEIWKWRNGFAYLIFMDAIVHRPEEEDLKRMLRDSKAWGSHHVIVEDNYGGGAFATALKPHARDIYEDGRGCLVESVVHTKMKEKRMIGAWEVPLTQHRIVVSTKVVERDHELNEKTDYHLLYQMSRVRELRGCLVHDDRLDCGAGALEHLSETGVFDVDYREQMDKDDKAEDARELEAFMLEGGLPVQERTFISGNAACHEQAPRRLR